MVSRVCKQEVRASTITKCLLTHALYIHHCKQPLASFGVKPDLVVLYLDCHISQNSNAMWFVVRLLYYGLDVGELWRGSLCFFLYWKHPLPSNYHILVRSSSSVFCLPALLLLQMLGSCHFWSCCPQTLDDTQSLGGGYWVVHIKSKCYTVIAISLFNLGVSYPGWLSPSSTANTWHLDSFWPRALRSWPPPLPPLQKFDIAVLVTRLSPG